MESRVGPAVRALWRAVRRDLGTFAALRANNFFLFVALMMYGAFESGTMPVSSYPFLAVLGFLMLFPLAADPLAKVPRARLGGWPLDRRQRAVLRLSALAFSPMLWLTAGLLFSASKAALALIAIPIATHSAARPTWHPLRRMPTLPGRLAEPVRASLRQLFTVLDAYLAIAIALAAHLPAVPADARPILAMLVALALSTYAQCPFSLDGPSTRYRLLPLPGWQIVLAKDAAYLIVLFVLTANIAPIPALTFGLIALAVGRRPAVTARLPVERWRFAGGRVFYGAAQIVLGIALSQAEAAYGPIVFLGLLPLYALSVWLGGRSLFQDSVVRQ
jgi:hypothetical protein